MELMLVIPLSIQFRQAFGKSPKTIIGRICMECREFLEKITDRNQTKRGKEHLEVCSGCRVEYYKHQEIDTILQMTRIKPSENFTKNLYQKMPYKSNSIWDRLVFFVDYVLYRFSHTPFRVVWMAFLVVATISLPVWYLKYIDNYKQYTNHYKQSQALPLWKMPVDIQR